MKAAFYSGASGLIAYQEALDTIGNNIANINTNGYKAQTTSFHDLLYTDMYTNSQTSLLTGHGVMALTAGIEPEQQTLVQTGGSLDFAINGDGWFAIEKDGQIQYTRDGCFSIGIKGSTASLVTRDGGHVLGSRGRAITCRSDDVADRLNSSELCGEIGIYTFSNPQGLNPVSSSRYAQTDISGEAVNAKEDDYQIVSGFLEQSGVSLADEISNMIFAQRAYQVSARVMQVADENEQTINNLRK